MTETEDPKQSSDQKDFSFKTEATAPSETMSLKDLPKGTRVESDTSKWVSSILDPITAARKIHFRGRPLNRVRFKFREIVEVFVYATIFAVIIRVFLVESFRISSMSMAPNLYDGDFVLASKLDFGFRMPISHDVYFAKQAQRGDMIIYRNEKRDEFQVKRIIGLPGDRISVQSGRVILNKKPIIYLAKQDQLWQSQGLIEYEENLPSLHSVLLPTTGDVSSSSEAIIPEDFYFVMGDDRASSEDSRHFGPIPSQWVIGKVRWVWLSIQKEPTWRIRREQIGGVK